MTRRSVRLLVLLGVAFAAYLVLSLFDHAARADAGSTNHIGATNPVATAADARKAIPETKSIIPKSTAAKAHPQLSHRATITTPPVQPPRVQAPKKINAPQIRVPRKIQAPGVRARETVRRSPVRISKLRQSTSDVVRAADRAMVTSARKAVARPKSLLPAQLVSPPGLVELPDLPQAALASWTQLPQVEPLLPSWSQLPRLPQAQLPLLPQLPALPPAWTPVRTQVSASPGAPVPHPPLMPPASEQVCAQLPAGAPAQALSDVAKSPATQAQPRTAPLPAPPRQPAYPSTSTGQARDSGGGTAPAMGTVSSSWQPEVAAAGRRLATNLIARGRTVRYAGPPS